METPELLKIANTEYEKTGIYMIFSKTTEKVYIGHTRQNFRKRINKHKSSLTMKKHPNLYLQNIHNKYGMDNLLFLPIELIDKENSLEYFLERETYYIKSIDKEKLLNLIIDPENYKLSEYTKHKMTKSLKGRKFTEEHKKRISEGLKKILANKIISAEEHKNRSEAQKTKNMSEEKRIIFKQKLSLAMSGKNNPNYGKKHTLEELKKMSENRKGKLHNEESKKKMSQKAKGRKRSKESIIKGTLKFKETLATKIITDEERENRAKAQRGKKYGEDTKRKLSEMRKGKGNSFYGKTHSEETLKIIKQKATEQAQKTALAKIFCNLVSIWTGGLPLFKTKYNKKV